MKRVRTPKIPGAAQFTVAKLPAPRAVTSASVLKLFWGFLKLFLGPGIPPQPPSLLSFPSIHPFLFQIFFPSCALHVGNALILFHFKVPWQAMGKAELIRVVVVGVGKTQ